MDFGQALSYLKGGVSMKRAGWNGKGMRIEMQLPDAHSKMTNPYLYIVAVVGSLTPWVASQTDILAHDWDEYHV